MTAPGTPVRSVAREAEARRILRAWRELAGQTSRGPVGREGATLIACSAGADSSALAIALSPLGRRAVMAHVVHDLRPERDALADRDAARELAGRLGLRFVEACVQVRGAGGNVEAQARRLRYACLAKLAVEQECPLVATAHHADDQLETVLMRLLRGAGPTGLGGIRPARPLAPGVRLIRPMLGITREDAERLCRAAGWAWRTDATNADTSRLRAYVRHRVAPVMREVRPDVANSVSRSTELWRAAGTLLDERAAELRRRAAPGGDDGEPGGLRWDRPVLAREPGVVVGQLLRLVAAELAPSAGLDRANQESAARAVRGIRDGVGGRRFFRLGPVEVVVRGDQVCISRVR